jgi:hypothetical protein
MATTMPLRIDARNVRPIVTFELRAPSLRVQHTYCGAIDVFTTNDWLVVEPNVISTLTTISVPAVTGIDVGFPMRSEQQGDTPTASTSRGGRTPS